MTTDERLQKLIEIMMCQLDQSRHAALLEKLRELEEDGKETGPLTIEGIADELLSYVPGGYIPGFRDLLRKHFQEIEEQTRKNCIEELKRMFPEGGRVSCGPREEGILSAIRTLEAKGTNG